MSVIDVGVREQVGSTTWAVLADPHASALLTALWGAPGPLTVTELGTESSLDLDAVEASLDRLAAEGVLAQRDADGHERFELNVVGLTRLVTRVRALVEAPPAAACASA